MDVSYDFVEPLVSGLCEGRLASGLADLVKGAN